MHTFVLSAVAAALGGVFVIGASPQPASARSGEDPIKMRQAAMKQNGANLRAIGGFLNGGPRAGSAESVARRGEMIAAIADKLPAMFPKGTSVEDKGLSVTGAKPEIWQQWDRFTAAAANLKRLAGELTEAANTGDKGAIKTAMGNLGKQGCGSCHRTFRQKRPKKK